MFCIPSRETFSDDTLTITNSNEFDEISQYSTAVIIDENVDTIPSSTFSEWSSLLSAIIGDSVTTIESYAFSSCYNLESIVIGKSVQIFGDRSFQNSNFLQNITFPDSVISFGECVIILCEKIKFFKISENNPYFCNLNDDGVLYDKTIQTIYFYPACKESITYEIPSTVTATRESSFYSSGNLEEIINCKNIIDFGNFTFCLCTNLKAFTISNKISIISYGLFSYCISLSTVCIGENVKIINDYAFNWCNELKCVYFYGETEPTISDIAFYIVTDKIEIMVLKTYLSNAFKIFSITFGTVSGCSTAYTNSNTFSKSNIFTKSNTFPESNSFTNSNTFSKSNSFTNSNTFSKSNTFTKSNTFSKSNTFTKSNTFSKSNTFTNSNTFSKSNALINSNTFMKSFPFTSSNAFTKSNSFVLENSYEFRQHFHIH